MQQYYLGVDFGTSSTKATILDDTGTIVAHTLVKNELLNPAESYYEVDPIHSWWEGFLRILNTFRPYLDAVCSVSVSSICASFVPLNSDLEPVYNAVMYGIDCRAVNQLERMNAKVGNQELRKRFGGEFTTHSVLPKILWFKENRPDVYERTAHFTESSNFITSRLTGNLAWDYQTATAARLVELKTLSVPSDILEYYGIDSQKIPHCIWATDKLGEVSAEGARRTGLPIGASVFMSACDVNAEALAASAVFPGDTVCVFGSTISLLHTTCEPKEVEGFVSGYSLLRGTYRLGAATSSGTRFLEKMDTYFGFEGYLDTKGKILPPTGLLIQPYIDGARTPFDDPDASGVIWGMNGNTKRDSFFLASREALGYELALLCHCIEQSGESIKTLHCMGGLSGNRSVMQIVADITGKQLYIHSGVDASYGDGILAMLAHHPVEESLHLAGYMKHYEQMQRIEPDPESHRLYAPYVKKYLRMFPLMQELDDV